MEFAVRTGQNHDPDAMVGAQAHEDIGNFFVRMGAQHGHRGELSGLLKAQRSIVVHGILPLPPQRAV